MLLQMTIYYKLLISHLLTKNYSKGARATGLGKLLPETGFDFFADDIANSRDILFCIVSIIGDSKSLFYYSFFK